MKYIDEFDIENKKVLVRVDFNVSLNPNHTIANDARIKQSIPTLLYLLKNHNTLILVSHLGQPKGRDEAYSLKRVATDLQKYFPHHKVHLINDFLSGHQSIEPSSKVIYLLENIRFYEGEKNCDSAFAKELAKLADIYVNDAFSVSHRPDSSIVGIPKLLPSYGGLLLKKEIEHLDRIVTRPKKPLVAILGGAKISTKIKLIDKLTKLADHLLIGGGLANTFLKAQGMEIGKSIVEDQELHHATRLIELAKKHKTELAMPTDVIVGDINKPDGESQVKGVKEVEKHEYILDIGPATQAHFGNQITTAKTIVWNGPMGYFESPLFRRGTDYIYYAITENSDALSVVGGGETLAAIDKKEYLEKITHISTGGGAMLDYMQNGSLPGIEALNTHG